MSRCQVTVQTPVHSSFRVRQVMGMFDLPEQTEWSETFAAEIPAISENWSIGCIIGPSGSGKSTLARAAYGAAIYQAQPWPAGSAMIDSLGNASIQQITQTLTAVGLGSPPAWLKPFAVLSNGEKFRCELARALLSAAESNNSEKLLVFDEFTSLVDRTVAKVASAAISKAIRSGRLNCRFVAVSCHADIAPWLEPDWVLDLGANEAGPTLSRVRLRRPRLQLQVTRCPQRLWHLFARHHYLVGGLSRAATCYAAWLDGRPIAFCALLAILGHRKHKRISRIVTLPDYQGLGIGLRLAERVADDALTTGFRVSITASHPAVIGACRQSNTWRLVSYRPLGNRTRQRFQSRSIPNSAGRGVATFEYFGSSLDEVQS
ncbi:Acetyltransferase (GNAT) family protein [Anatilimnocola aggregata]|uniref:Acetyltransferase (GNAT) family protein n=1 Tax=Anatilimnocola aggregata TaxID=2528021 RepID=A0A517YNU3_9BACT|nr:GNAT family N-acetyltransferase [Anatilimnocola aggregata]QDU31880.1 Acetyltransferase (GNAT) family protein [Anatilimnocola aggregata]